MNNRIILAYSITLCLAVPSATAGIVSFDYTNEAYYYPDGSQHPSESDSGVSFVSSHVATDPHESPYFFSSSDLDADSYSIGHGFTFSRGGDAGGQSVATANVHSFSVNEELSYAINGSLQHHLGVYADFHVYLYGYDESNTLHVLFDQILTDSSGSIEFSEATGLLMPNWTYQFYSTSSIYNSGGLVDDGDSGSGGSSLILEVLTVPTPDAAILGVVGLASVVLGRRRA